MKREVKVPVILGVGAAVMLLVGLLLFLRASGGRNHVTLDSRPKGVTVISAESAPYRATRVYVGTLQPWVLARVGPQMISAYVDTVLVRPGAAVKRGEVLATLDCRNASAASKSIQMQARALESTQVAAAKEASRVTAMLEGGFVSPNEVDQKTAESASKQSQLLGLQAQMLGTSLQVADCVLRAPFDGEVSAREVDPGAFVRPGTPMLTVVDRRLVRVTADVPEEDFEVVAPGTPMTLHLLASGQDLTGTVSRRSPSADESTRTIHVELDIPNPDSRMPVGTTAELKLAVGKPVDATRIPLAAASVRGKSASVFEVVAGVARSRTVPTLGEDQGTLYVAPTLKAGAQVVIEGRAGLADGDRVESKQAVAAK